MFRILLNHGACADILFDYEKKAIHDELVVAYSIYSSKMGKKSLYTIY